MIVKHKFFIFVPLHELSHLLRPLNVANKKVFLCPTLFLFPWKRSMVAADQMSKQKQRNKQNKTQRKQTTKQTKEPKKHTKNPKEINKNP